MNETIFDKISQSIANIIVYSKKDKFDYKPLPNVKEEIELLREQLEKKTREAEDGRIDWEQTFNSMIDGVAIIDSDMKIVRFNNSFVRNVKNVKPESCNDFIGMDWKCFRDFVGISNICIVEECLKTGQPKETVIDYGNFVFHIVTNPIIEDGKVVKVIRVSRDVTESEIQKRRLDRRGKVLLAISELSKILTNHDNWDFAVSSALKQLGAALGVHRAYIYTNVIRNNRMCALLSDIWHNPDSKNKCNADEILTECVNYDHLGEWKQYMEKGRTVQGPMANCDICPNKERCAKLEEIMVSAVPIFSNGQWWGFLGFDYHNGTKKWRQDDEVLLKVVADILGGVIYHRQRYYDTLQKLEDGDIHG